MIGAEVSNHVDFEFAMRPASVAIYQVAGTDGGKLLTAYPDNFNNNIDG